MPPKATHTPAVIELSSDSEDDFDAPIGQKPTTSSHFKRPAPAAPSPAARPAKKVRLSSAKSNTGGWAPGQLDRLLEMYDSQLQESGTPDYGEIVKHFPGRSRKDLHAAVYRARKKKRGRALEAKAASTAGGSESGAEVRDETGTATESTAASEAEPEPEPEPIPAVPATVEPAPSTKKPSKPRASATNPWLPAEVARLIAAYDQTVADHGRPRYDLITPQFPGRTKEALQSQVSGYKKKAAKGQVAAAPVGGVQAWLAKPAAPKPKPRLTEVERRLFGKQCRAVLRLLEMHAGAGGVVTVE